MVEELVEEIAGEVGFRALERADAAYPEGSPLRAVIATHHGVEPNNPGLLPLIALCWEHDFSPTSGMVHLIPHLVRVADGTDGRERMVEKWSPAIGRDGLLALARRTLGKPYGYRGHKVAWIGAADEFEATFAGDAMSEPIIRHVIARKTAAALVFDRAEAKARGQQPPDPAMWRGDVIGAWAVAYFDGMPTAFYHANIREYGRWETIAAADGGELEERIFAGAWRYTAAMAEKCGESRVLRQGLGVTGFVPVDELLDVGAFQRGEFSMGVFADRRDAQPVFDFGEIADEELRAGLRDAVDRANELEPFAWSPAKCAMVMRGRSVEELRAVLDRIDTENVARIDHVERRAAALPASAASRRGKSRRAPRRRRAGARAAAAGARR